MSLRIISLKVTLFFPSTCQRPVIPGKVVVSCAISASLLMFNKRAKFVYRVNAAKGRLLFFEYRHCIYPLLYAAASYLSSQKRYKSYPMLKSHPRNIMSFWIYCSTNLFALAMVDLGT